MLTKYISSDYTTQSEKKHYLHYLYHNENIFQDFSSPSCLIFRDNLAENSLIMDTKFKYDSFTKYLKRVKKPFLLIME